MYIKSKQICVKQKKKKKKHESPLNVLQNRNPVLYIVLVSFRSTQFLMARLLRACRLNNINNNNDCATI